jgi:hypothetical protein
MVAAIGAVVLARRRRGLEEPDERFEERVSAPRPAYTGTLAEGAGTRAAGSAAPTPEVEPVATGTRARVEPDNSGQGGW